MEAKTTHSPTFKVEYPKLKIFAVKATVTKMCSTALQSQYIWTYIKKTVKPFKKELELHQ